LSDLDMCEKSFKEWKELVWVGKEFDDDDDDSLCRTHISS